MAEHSERPTFTEEDERVYDVAEPEPEDELGGRVEDEEPEHPSVLMSLVRSLMPGQELSRVTIPSWFLESRSLLEKFTDTMMHPQLLLRVSELDDPLERMKSMLAWYLSGFHFRTTGAKKPYNPIIGETFACYWEHPDGSRSQYLAEQVLHRPPITALYFENAQHNLVCNGQVHTRSRISGTLNTAQSMLEGFAHVHLLDRSEVYHLTFPIYNAHGLLFGTLRTEISGHTVLYCEATDLRADIEFHQKPTFGGSNQWRRATAQISRISDGSVFGEADGHWDREFTYKAAGSNKAEPFLKIPELEYGVKRIVPAELQNPWESRRLWQRTTEAISTRPRVDWDRVTAEKLRLEDEQRELACHKTGKEYRSWETKFFHTRMVHNPLTNEDEEAWVFDYMPSKPFGPDQPSMNLLALSRKQRDVRTPDVAPPSLPASGGGGGGGGGGAAAAGSGE